jgi:acyl transferase domain-containing protein
LDHLRRGVEVWPEISADTQPGEMPNIVASRISNYFDIRGLNMVVDGGEASLLQAFEAAARYLETDDLELALVGGVSANPHPAWAASIRSAQAVQNTSGIREGAYLFAVTKQSTARAAGLPVLAHVEC